MSNASIHSRYKASNLKTRSSNSVICGAHYDVKIDELATRRLISVGLDLLIPVITSSGSNGTQSFIKLSFEQNTF